MNTEDKNNLKVDGEIKKGEKAPAKWYHHPAYLVMLFLLVGPFMLPAVWNNPRYSSKVKKNITAVILLITLFLAYLMYKSITSIGAYNSMMLQLMEKF